MKGSWIERGFQGNGQSNFGKPQITGRSDVSINYNSKHCSELKLAGIIIGVIFLSFSMMSLIISSQSYNLIYKVSTEMSRMHPTSNAPYSSGTCLPCAACKDGTSTMETVTTGSYFEDNSTVSTSTILLTTSELQNGTVTPSSPITEIVSSTVYLSTLPTQTTSTTTTTVEPVITDSTTTENSSTEPRPSTPTLFQTATEILTFITEYPPKFRCSKYCESPAMVKANVTVALNLSNNITVTFETIMLGSKTNVKKVKDKAAFVALTALYYSELPKVRLEPEWAQDYIGCNNPVNEEIVKCK